MRTKLVFRPVLATLAVLGALSTAGGARAEAPPAATTPPATDPAATTTTTTTATATTTTTTDTTAKPAPAKEDDKSGGVLIGAKVGGILPFSKLSPNVSAGVEIGYAFGSFAVALDVDYTAPKSSATESDPRVAGSSYTWHLTQQELNFMPVFLYRLKLGALTPFAGIGPRLYLLQSTVRSNDGGPKISETTEKSTKFGFGVPLGVELKAGPGALLGEVLIQYGGLNHTATGTSNTGSASLSIGYRLVL